MKLTTTAILVSLAATAFLFPAASAVPQPYVCSNEVNPSCGHTVCFAPSYTQVPRCEDVTLSTPAHKLGYCTEGKSPCYLGRLACVTDNGAAVVCIPDPCATTQCFAASSPACQGCLPWVCVAGQTAPSCYEGHDVCVGFSLEIPFCTDVPCGDGSCVTITAPGYCTQGEPPCDNFDLLCVTAGGSPVLCFAQPCSVSECLPPSEACASCALPPVEVCVAGTTEPSCYHDAPACVTVSRQVPKCLEATPIEGGVNCYETYWRHDVGPVGVESRSSCDYRVYYDGQPILS